MENNIDSNENYIKDVTVFVCGKCNSNCLMCPSTEYERKKELQSDAELFEFIDGLGTDINYCVVTGGEPTLYKKRFISSMMLLADKTEDAETLLLTNARSFASKKYLNEMLNKCPSHMVVGVPIHGSCAEVHDMITQAPGSFDQTMKGISNLLDCKIAVEIRIVITKLNQNDIENIARLIVDRIHAAIRVNFISLEVRGNCLANKDLVYIDPQASFYKAKGAIDYLLDNGMDVNLYNYPLCSVDRGYWLLCKKSITPSKVRYKDSCELCKVRELCGGFFATTLAFTNPKTFPIE